MLHSKRKTGLRSTCSAALLAAGLFTVAAQAQTVPSAEGARPSLWVGGEYANIQAGFPYASSSRLSGIGAFADYHFTGRIGIEGAARFFRFSGFESQTEDNYLAGPRYMTRFFGNWQPYAQCLVGIGRIQYPFQIGTGNYLAVAPAAGVNFRIGRIRSRWSATGAYEYQFWINSPNIVNEPQHQITPNGFHVGLSYELVR